MELIIKCPANRLVERKYIIDVIFGWFPIRPRIIFEERSDVKISMIDSEKNVIIKDVFLGAPSDVWGRQESLPSAPLNQWSVSDAYRRLEKDAGGVRINSTIPVIYGCYSNDYFYLDGCTLHVGIDIFGSAFYMLTRYEEFVLRSRDSHGWFPARDSILLKENLIHRPIINEYVEILSTAMSHISSECIKTKGEFVINPSHDIDIPFMHYDDSFWGVSKKLAGDLIKRKSLTVFNSRLNSWYSSACGSYQNDAYYTYDKLMDLSDAYSLKSTFFIKVAATNRDFDNYYSIEDRRIRNLILNIHKRGHKVGLHPSYESYLNDKQMVYEVSQYRKLCEELDVTIDGIESRQHYLRIEAPTTWRILEKSGVSIDCTLCFAEIPGFRAGICYEYQLYDLINNTPLKLIERPLLLMEESLFDQEFLGYSKEQAMELVLRIKENCRKFSGQFNILWHNNSFKKKVDWDFYRSVLSND